MTLNQLAESYEVESIPQYIYESFLNGQHKQVLELIKECNQLDDYDDEILMITLTDFMFTGYAAPVESMPQALQWFANFIPAYHWLRILRGILLKGVGLEVLWPHVLALVVLGTVIGFFSVRFVRRALS